MKITYKILIILPLLLMILSCGSNKVNVPVDEVIQATPCFGAGYFSTKDAFRASAIGESMDQMTARKKAMANARQELATSISATINIVGDNYVKSTENNNVEQVLEQFQSLGRTVVNQKLSGIVQVCETNTRSKSTGNYKYYIAIELGSQELMSNLAETLSKDKVLQVDYNYEKFKDTFEKEMSKLKKQ
jgi:predicted transcriptional regulator YdeE